MAQVLTGTTGRLAAACIGIGVALAGINQCIYNVDGGHQAIIFDRFRGILPKVYAEGTHFRVPVVQNPIVYNVRIRPHIMSSAMSTKDIQTVSISLRILSRPNIAKLPWIYRKLGVDYDERVLPSIGNEVLKSVAAQYNADQLVTKRHIVSQEIRNSLTKRAAEYGIEVEDVSITHLGFSKEFALAIEQKQVAQQEAERSKFIVQKSEQEKKAAIIRAEGESESATLINMALAKTGNGLVEIRRIETAVDIATSLAKSQGVTYIPSSGILLNIPTTH